MRLAGFELRRFTRAPLTAAALAALALIPLLYGALYLWAFWDPTGNLGRVPVALVDEDRPVTDADGHRVHAGRDLATRLLERQAFGWDPTDAADAERGLREGRYHLVFRIPAGFSAALVTPPDPAADPTQGRLTVVNDDATNDLSGVLARGVFTEVRAA
ncbi:MAG TPA: YhgE/Pip family protein, partial [Pilimelia sp.]|nr:YhgE/Pip family protein [Pilimelia sp.]